MSKYSVSDFVASAMDAVLKSDSHKSLFASQYKIASADEDENDARKKSKKPDCEELGEHSCKSDCSKADDVSFLDDENDARKKKKVVKEEDDQDEDMKASAAFDIAIDSLLSASAALDSVGMEKSATFSLQLATLVVEAKKKDSKDKAEKLKEKQQFFKSKEKAKKEKDVQMAKDKAMKEKVKEKAKKEKDVQMAKYKASKEKIEKEVAKSKAEKK